MANDWLSPKKHDAYSQTIETEHNISTGTCHDAFLILLCENIRPFQCEVNIVGTNFSMEFFFGGGSLWEMDLGGVT